MQTLSQHRATCNMHAAAVHQSRSRQHVCPPVSVKRRGSTQGYTADPLKGRWPPQRPPQGPQDSQNASTSQSPQMPQRGATIPSESSDQGSRSRYCLLSKLLSCSQSDFAAGNSSNSACMKHLQHRSSQCAVLGSQHGLLIVMQGIGRHDRIGADVC